MSIAALSLVVLAALVHASWNLMAKQAADGGPAFVFAYNLVACIAYAPWVLWLIAQGHVAWSGAVALCILASSLLHLAYSLALQRGYQVADLSVVYPVARGSGPMLSSIAAFLLLGETATVLKLAGLAAVVGGIVMIATQGNFAAFSRPAGHAGLRWGLLTGALIATCTVVDAYGVKALAIAPVVLDWTSNSLRFVMLAPVIALNRATAWERMRGRWKWAVGVGLLSPLSYILVLGALNRGAPVSIVAPAREMSMMVGALLGMLILREPVGPWRLLGCAVLIGGVVALGLS